MCCLRTTLFLVLYILGFLLFCPHCVQICQAEFGGPLSGLFLDLMVTKYLDMDGVSVDNSIFMFTLLRQPADFL